MKRLVYGPWHEAIRIAAELIMIDSILALLLLAAACRSALGATPLPADPPPVRGAAPLPAKVVAPLPADPPAVKGFCPCRARGLRCDCAGACACGVATAPVFAPAAPIRVCGPSGCYYVYPR